MYKRYRGPPWELGATCSSSLNTVARVPEIFCLLHLHICNYIRNMHAMLQVGKQYKNLVYAILFTLKTPYCTSLAAAPHKGGLLVARFWGGVGTILTAPAFIPRFVFVTRMKSFHLVAFLFHRGHRG